MQLRHAFTIAAASAALAACASRQVEVTSGNAGATSGASTSASTSGGMSADTTHGGAMGAMGGMAMSAQLMQQGGSGISGTGTVAHGDSPSQFRSSASIWGAGPNAVHPWHVHEGRCGDNGPVVGPPGAYPPLQADAHGAATATTTLPVPMPAGPLYVNVHLSKANMGTIVSCGNLAM